MEEGRKQTEALIAAFIGQMGQLELEQPSPKAPLVVISSFDPFDPTTELWDDTRQGSKHSLELTPFLWRSERWFSSPTSRA